MCERLMDKSCLTLHTSEDCFHKDCVVFWLWLSVSNYRLYLSYGLIFPLSVFQVVDSNGEFFLKSSELFESSVYLEEVADVLCILQAGTTLLSCVFLIDLNGWSSTHKKNANINVSCM